MNNRITVASLVFVISILMFILNGCSSGVIDKHTCTAQEKAAEVCTLQYDPVCGSDGTTYSNGCFACGSKKIDFYFPGECENVPCTEDAKLCDDGSYVGRTPPDCEFDCPKTNFTRKYVGFTTEECSTMLFQCIPGASPFFDDTGCGCEASKYYIGNSISECSLIRYFCANQTIPFNDNHGCGCIFDWGNEGKLKANDCLPEQRNVSCTKEYEPVCGWFNTSIKCIRYPCAATFGNKCMACNDPIVAYYTEGGCPEQ